MSTKTKRLVLSALLLAAGLVLPFLTGGIPNFGRCCCAALCAAGNGACWWAL